jgi:hypothetical protein
MPPLAHRETGGPVACRANARPGPPDRRLGLAGRYRQAFLPSFGFMHRTERNPPIQSVGWSQPDAGLGPIGWAGRPPERDGSAIRRKPHECLEKQKTNLDKKVPGTKKLIYYPFRHKNEKILIITFLFA